MEKNQNYYSLKGATICSLLGGPLAAAYVLYYNFNQFDKKLSALISSVTLILYTIAVFWTALFLRYDYFVSLPLYIIPTISVLFTSLTYILFLSEDARKAKLHKWETRSLFPPVTTGIGILVFFTAIFTTSASLRGHFDTRAYYFNNYDSVIYYIPTVEREKIEEFANALTLFEHYDKTNHKYFYVYPMGEKIYIEFPIPEEEWAIDIVRQEFIQFRYYLTDKVFHKEITITFQPQQN